MSLRARQSNVQNLDKTIYQKRNRFNEIKIVFFQPINYNELSYTKLKMITNSKVD